ncbi:hydroxyacylglutathione hydrolase [Aerococcaceae bacterium DSM 111020]|nr:hydroxyacylglutathione hydrolase [Aerococcaceae bacterium DSM 111020]
MNIHAIPALNDNYIWAITDNERAIIVDPGEAEPVLTFLQDNQLTLDCILLTHHHDDHIGGVQDLTEKFDAVTIYGPTEVSELTTITVADGDCFDLWDQVVEVHLTAGHTEGHISYLMEEELFCGDALFSGGCGRVFIKDYDAAYQGMQYFNALPDSVRIYAGHEYTLTNLRFAEEIDPDNQAIKQTKEEVEALRDNKQPTLPSTIGVERKINLFMTADSVEQFKELRDQRDNF